MPRKSKKTTRHHELIEKHKSHVERQSGIRPDIVLDATAEDADWIRVARRQRLQSAREWIRRRAELHNDLERIEELFHGLIRSRIREGHLAVPATLPSLNDLVQDSEPAWFPVPGMAGGFQYQLQLRSGALSLVAESWSRVAGGSGMRHVITPTQVVLEAQGFV